MIEPVEIINRFTEYSPSKGEEPLPLPIPGHWFRKICALAERIARAENERDTLRARIAELEADAAFHPRAAKLIRKRKNFVVVAENEPYFMKVYFLIRSHEYAKGTWSYEDEQLYQAAISAREPLKDGPP
jgi:hypothetical protein